MNLFPDESARREAFPICASGVFFSHAAVTALPRVVAQAMADEAWSTAQQPADFQAILRQIAEARAVCARFIGAQPDEIALLGPTSLGLSLVANGLPWKEGDEVVCYADDYPANVYPWLELQRRGVVVRLLKPAVPGEITPELVEAVLSPRTRLVALASAHYFSGFRIDLAEIGRRVRSRGVLFCVDAIQTLGAFPLDVGEIDFLSADAHKWMLGPVAIGIVYVRREHWETLRPTLVGAWNTICPNLVSLGEVQFVDSAQRYEPGVLNLPGIAGMRAGIELLMATGMENVGARVLELKQHLTAGLDQLGFRIIGPRSGEPASGITTCAHPSVDARELFTALEGERIFASLRFASAGNRYLRWSPHYYNTEAELDRALAVLSGLPGITGR